MQEQTARNYGLLCLFELLRNLNMLLRQNVIAGVPILNGVQERRPVRQRPFGDYSSRGDEACCVGLSEVRLARGTFAFVSGN